MTDPHDYAALVERLRWGAWYFDDPFDGKAYASDDPLDAADAIEALIAAGDKLVCLIVSGNRDAAVFPEPDRFDHDRFAGRGDMQFTGGGDILPFGAGSHHCAGSRLAQAEMAHAFTEFIARVRAGGPDPHCELCGGIVKSDAILFEQALVPEVIERAMREADECDLLIAVGSTLAVSPANGVVPRARATGAKVVIINGQGTEMDRFADVLLIASITPALQAIVASAR